MPQIKLDQILLEGGTQLRERLNTTAVAEYAQAIQDGAKFPPVVVFWDGTEYWLADGFHRVHAAEACGRKTIKATVQAGSKRDAILYSVQANATHGLRRTNADKRKAVMLMLNDEEWAKWSDREIAKQCNVSHTFVAKMRGNVATNTTMKSHKPNKRLALPDYGRLSSEESLEQAKNSPLVRKAERLIKGLVEKDQVAVGELWLSGSWPNMDDIRTLAHETYRAMDAEERAKFLAWVEAGCPQDARVEANLTIERMNQYELDAIQRWLHEELKVPLGA